MSDAPYSYQTITAGADRAEIAYFWPGAADPLARFIDKNPTIVMLALGFLLMIGGTLIGEGFGAHIPKGYIYAAMAFSALVEVLNMFSRNARQRSKGAGGH